MVIKIKKETEHFVIGILCSKCGEWLVQEIPIPAILKLLVKKVEVGEIEQEIPGKFICSDCETEAPKRRPKRSRSPKTNT